MTEQQTEQTLQELKRESLKAEVKRLEEIKQQLNAQIEFNKWLMYKAEIEGRLIDFAIRLENSRYTNPAYHQFWRQLVV